MIVAINIAFQIGIPSSRDKLRQIANWFTSRELWGWVSAIDGWVCKTRKPHQSKVRGVMAYQNHHGCWGLVVLAGCDANCHYNIFSCMYSGSTNYCLAWDISKASKVVEHHDWNFYLSSMQQCIECSFALLVQRWGILWHPIQIEFSGLTKVLMALVNLHNFLLMKVMYPLGKDKPPQLLY